MDFNVEDYPKDCDSSEINIDYIKELETNIELKDILIQCYFSKIEKLEEQNKEILDWLVVIQCRIA